MSEIVFYIAPINHGQSVHEGSFLASSALVIACAGLILPILTTFLWRIWRHRVLPLDIIHSSAVTRRTDRIKGALARIWKGRTV